MFGARLCLLYERFRCRTWFANELKLRQGAKGNVTTGSYGSSPDPVEARWRYYLALVSSSQYPVQIIQRASGQAVAKQVGNKAKLLALATGTTQVVRS
jgi:hypothetical protein